MSEIKLTNEKLNDTKEQRDPRENSRKNVDTVQHKYHSAVSKIRTRNYSRDSSYSKVTCPDNTSALLRASLNIRAQLPILPHYHPSDVTDVTGVTLGANDHWLEQVLVTTPY